MTFGNHHWEAFETEEEALERKIRILKTENEELKEEIKKLKEELELNKDLIRGLGVIYNFRIEKQ